MKLNYFARELIRRVHYPYPKSYFYSNETANIDTSDKNKSNRGGFPTLQDIPILIQDKHLAKQFLHIFTNKIHFH
jgi:hypothetical protein